MTKRLSCHGHRIIMLNYSTDPVMELIRAYETSASDNDTDTNCSATETQPQLLLNQVRSVYLVT